jgi:hypothetical protein
MKINCEDRERVFRDGAAEEWAALELHAATCAECGEELRAWKALSVAAEELREYRPTPELWRRIELSLQEQAEKKGSRQWSWDWLKIWRSIPIGWQTALVGAMVLALTVSAAYFVIHRPPISPSAENRLLKSDALKKVEEAESAYVQAIDKLAVDAKPPLEDSTSPLMASYREKLMVLDSAIDDLRFQAGENPSNAHLRHQLLAMYQEKKETLTEILETKR